MRPDMEKVVTERPRRSGWGGSRNYHDSGQRSAYKRMDDEDFPTKHPMYNKAITHGDSKEFSDLIQPLYRFFRSNVGKNWDKVWSSICEHLPAKTLSAYHIRKQHLERMIEVTPLLVDGKYYSNDWDYQSRRERILRPFYKNEFYVDKQGCIREGKVERRAYWKLKKKDEPVTTFTRNGNTYHKTNGFWFLSKSRVIERRQWKSYTPRIEQRSWGTLVRPAEGMTPGYMPAEGEPEGEYITVKETVWLPSKQLNTKELRALGLVNDQS